MSIVVDSPDGGQLRTRDLIEYIEDLDHLPDSPYRDPGNVELQVLDVEDDPASDQLHIPSRIAERAYQLLTDDVTIVRR